MEKKTLIDKTICAILKTCLEKNGSNSLCILLEAIDESLNLCPSGIEVSNNVLDYIRDIIQQYKNSSRYTFVDKVYYIFKKIDGLETSDTGSKLIIAFTKLLEEVDSEGMSDSKRQVYKLIGEFTDLLTKTSIILAYENGYKYINIIVMEIINKKDQLMSSRRPLDLTRASLLMSDVITNVASNLPSKLEEEHEATTLGAWSIIRPHPLNNPYFTNLPHDLLVNMGGFNPAIAVAIAFSKSPLQANKISNIIYELATKYFKDILNNTLYKARIKSSEIPVLVEDGNKVIELLEDELPLPYIVTVKSFKIEPPFNIRIEELITTSFKSHERANPTRYVEFSEKHLVLINQYSDRGNPLCTNCYQRPAIILNKKPDPLIIQIERGSIEYLRVGLRPRERLCAYHILLRLEKNRDKEALGSNNLFVQAMSRGLRPKSVYGIASYYFRLLLYYIYLLLEKSSPNKLHNIDNCILNTLSHQYDGAEKVKIKDYLNTTTNISDKIKLMLSQLLRPEQSLGEPCKALPHSDEIRKWCNILKISDMEKTLNYLTEAQLRLYELLSTLAIHYPELLYPQRLHNLTGQHIKELERFYNYMLIINTKLSKERDCLQQLSAIGPLRFTPSNYYTLVYIDADNASRLFSGEMKGFSYAIESSVLLSREGLNSNAITRVIFSGMPLFLGGDDVIVMVPPEDSFRVATSFYKILETVGLTASIVIQFTHYRVPLRFAIFSLFESMKSAKSVSLGGREFKNSITITRITGMGKKDSATIPITSFTGNVTAMWDYFSGLVLANRLSQRISVRRVLRAAFEEISLGKYGARLAYYKLSKLLEGMSDSRSHLPIHVSKRILETLDISLGLNYRIQPSIRTRDAFEELIKASLIILEPEILGDSILEEWSKVNWK